MLIVADIIRPTSARSATWSRCCATPCSTDSCWRRSAASPRTAVSPYRKLRNQLGIAQYTEAEFM